MTASILIPAYNAASVIEETLASCVFQGKNCVCEIIIIDDHSADNTIDVAEGFAKAHPHFKFIIETNPNKGACAARNYALSLASGKALQWLDADDIMGESKLERQLHLLRSNPGHLIASKWQRFSKDLSNLHPEEQGNWSAVPATSPSLDWLKSERMVALHGWLGTHELFANIGPWDESLLINQDGEYFTRALAASEGVIFEPKSRVYYRSGLSESVSHFVPEKAPSLFKSYESFERAALSIGSRNEVSPYISKRYQDFINQTFPCAPELRELAEQKILAYGGSTRNDFMVKKHLVYFIYALFGWNVLVLLRKLKSVLLRIDSDTLKL
jgi:glycosyltransferase involved in cell wall biosynthesis